MPFLQPKASLPKLCLVRPLELLIPICPRVIPIEIKDLYVGEGRAECVVYNLAHAIRPQLKRNLIKFLIRGAAYKRQVGSLHKPKLKLPTLPL